MITRKQLSMLHDAAKLIEIDGDEAYHTVCEKYGDEVAALLLIAHLRRSCGSMKSYPPDPAIEERVNKMLREKGDIQH